MAAKAKGALWSLHSLIVFLRLGDLGYTLDHCRYALQVRLFVRRLAKRVPSFWESL